MYTITLVVGKEGERSIMAATCRDMSSAYRLAGIIRDGMSAEVEGSAMTYVGDPVSVTISRAGEPTQTWSHSDGWRKL